MMNRQVCMLSLCLVTVNAPLMESDFSWKETPGLVRGLVGDTVHLHWEFISTEYPLSMIWLYNQSGYTILQHHVDRNVTDDDRLGERVKLKSYSQTHITIDIMNIAMHDAGGYELELGGIGEKDQINIRVYEDTDLMPSLQVNNAKHDFIKEVITTDPTILVATTGGGVRANITATVEGEIVVNCVLMLSCLYPVPRGQNFTVDWKIEYGLGFEVERKLVVKSLLTTAPNPSTEKTEEDHRLRKGAEAVIAVAVLVFLEVAVGLALYYFREPLALALYCRYRDKITRLIQKLEAVHAGLQPDSHANTPEGGKEYNVGFTSVDIPDDISANEESLEEFDEQLSSEGFDLNQQEYNPLQPTS